MTGQLAPKLHVSHTPSASIPSTVPSTSTAVEAHDSPRNSPYTASEGSSTTKKTRYQHKKAKGLRKNAAAGTPISTTSVILIADRGHDYPTGATSTGRGSASIQPNASIESNTEATIPERTKKAAQSERGDSEDESAYFTSEEVEESSSSNRIPQHEAPARFAVSNATVPVPVKSIAESVNPVFPRLQEASRSLSTSSTEQQSLPDPQHESRGSASISSAGNTDWHAILSSSVPRDIYETTDSGAIHCKPCSKRFSSFQSFENHYSSSAEHVPQTRLASDYGSSAREGQDGPPPLVRVQEEIMPQLERSSSPPPETYLSRQGRASRGPQPPLPSHVCALCNVNYTDLTALQRHKASSTREHPYYCQYCTEEYDNFEQLQTVRSFSLCSIHYGADTQPPAALSILPSVSECPSFGRYRVFSLQLSRLSHSSKRPTRSSHNCSTGTPEYPKSNSQCHIQCRRQRFDGKRPELPHLHHAIV